MFVDDAIHAQILRLLVRKPKPGEVIVIVTGDGNLNEGYTSFIEVCGLSSSSSSLLYFFVYTSEKLNDVMYYLL